VADVHIREGSFFHRLVNINAAHVRTEDGLRHLTGEDAVVLIGSPERLYKVCHLRFSNQGGIYVQAPYFQESDGLVGQLNWRPSGKGSVSASFEPGWARATSHLVKLHHPPDGNAHFSQDGKVNTEIWLKTFPLTTGRGFVFQLNMYGIEGHDYIAPDARLDKNRVYLPFVFNGPIPDALTVFGEWLPRRELAPQKGEPSKGPLVTYVESPGVEAQAFLLAPAGRSANSDFGLRVTGGKAPPIAKPEEPLLVLQGAWAESQSVNACLAFMYPAADPERSAATLGTIDRVPRLA
jgi:hypothetical protein